MAKKDMFFERLIAYGGISTDPGVIYMWNDPDVLIPIAGFVNFQRSLQKYLGETAFKDGELMGYVVFSPRYSNGQVVGYLSDIDRYRIKPELNTVAVAMKVHALKKFQEEGRNKFSFGLSPFYDCTDGGNTLANPVTTLLFQGVYEGANELYHFKGLALHKKQYRAAKERVFFCSKDPVPVNQVVDMFRACRVL